MASIEDRNVDSNEMAVVANGDVDNTGTPSAASRSTARADLDDVSHVQQDDKKVVNKKAEHRLKLIRSLYIFLSFVSLGMGVALSGPTFLDLILLVNVDIEHGTILFTSGSIGYLCGSLIGGVVYDKFNKELTLFFATLMTGVLTVLIPWCSYLPLMAVVKAFSAAAMGALDTGGNALIVSIWGKDVGLYMQAVHFAFGFGGIISPFVAAPFLAPKLEENRTTTVIQHGNITESPSYSGSEHIHYSPNGISGLLEINNTVPGANITDPLPVDQITRVHIPYLIIGLITAVSAFPFLEMFWADRKEKKKQDHKNEPDSEVELVRHIPLTLSLKVILLVLMGLFYILYCCVEDTFAGFIMTFVVEHLQWSKTKGTRITSVFWIAFSVGRLLAIGISKILKPWKMLAVDFVMLDLAFLALYLGVESSEAFCWAATVVVAISMASIFPTGITWIEKRIMKVTGKIASLLLICASGGTMANPILIGYLFESYTPMWFVYLLFAQALACSVVFIVTSVLVFWLHKQWKDRKSRGDTEADISTSNLERTGQTLIEETTNV